MQKGIKIKAATDTTEGEKQAKKNAIKEKTLDGKANKKEKKLAAETKVPDSPGASKSPHHVRAPSESSNNANTDET